MADKDIKLQGFDTVRTWASLIVTLSTGTIVFTATFRKDLAPEGEALKAIGALWWAWLVLGLATVLGILVFGSLAAKLNRNDANANNLDVYKFPTWLLAGLQLVFFLAGIVLFAYFAYANLPA